MSVDFLALHAGREPLLLGNVWDVGTAKTLAFLGFRALATTSSGHAATLGRHDGEVTRDEALAHAATLVGATGLPVSADLEDGFADDAAGTAETVRLPARTGLAGCSIEDWSRTRRVINDLALAIEKVAAAAAAAHAAGLVLTARAENHIRGVDDLDDTTSPACRPTSGRELLDESTYGYWATAGEAATRRGAEPARS